MAWDANWRERVAWSKRSPEFGGLTVRDGRPVMKYIAPISDRTWSHWVRLALHPSILSARPGNFLDYAALDWNAKPPSRALAGAELARVYEELLSRLGSKRVVALTAARVFYDLEGEVRLAFVDTARVPRFSIGVSAKYDERELVQLVGELLQAMATPATESAEVALVIEEAVNRTPRTLAALRASFEATPLTESDLNHETWNEIEKGIGFLELDQPGLAAISFTKVLDRAPKCLPALDGRAAAERRIKELGEVDVRRTDVDPLPRVIVDPLQRVMIDPSYAAAWSIPPIEARRLEPESRLGPPEPPARAAYVEGKAALVRGRLADAREAFDRALALQPQLLEAMLLRGEVERMTNRLRREVGTGDAKALPAHLAALEPLLLGDRFEDGIAQLRTFEDAAAQQLLADVLVRHGRADEALAIYDRLTSSEALAGRAAALQQLGRSAEAEAALDRYVALAVDRSELRTRGAQR